MLLSELLTESIPPKNVKQGIMKAFRDGKKDLRGDFIITSEPSIRWLNKELGTPGSSNNIIELGFATAVYNPNSDTWVV